MKFADQHCHPQLRLSSEHKDLPLHTLVCSRHSSKTCFMVRGPLCTCPKSLIAAHNMSENNNNKPVSIFVIKILGRQIQHTISLGWLLCYVHPHPYYGGKAVPHQEQERAPAQKRFCDSGKGREWYSGCAWTPPLELMNLRIVPYKTEPFDPLDAEGVQFPSFVTIGHTGQGWWKLESNNQGLPVSHPCIRL